MDESSTGSVEDLYSGLCTGPVVKTDMSDIDCLTSERGEPSLALINAGNHRERSQKQLNQNNPISDQDEEHEDDDALVIDAQDDPESAAETGSGGGDVMADGSKDAGGLALRRAHYSEDFAALESGEWRLQSNTECSTSDKTFTESLEKIRDLATAITSETEEATSDINDDEDGIEYSATISEGEANRGLTKSPNSSGEDVCGDQSDDSSVAVNLEGDTDLEDEPPINSNEPVEEHDIRKDKVDDTRKPMQHAVRKEEDALSALNSVLDILCKGKHGHTQDPDTLGTQCGDEFDLNTTYKNLYENLEELSSGESSIPNDVDSNDAMIENLLEAASEVSSGEDEMLKRNETIVENPAVTNEGTLENDNKENGPIEKDTGNGGPDKSVDRVEKNNADSDAPLSAPIQSDVKTNGTVSSFKLKRKSGLEEGELSDSNSEASHTSRRMHRLKRKRREKERIGLGGLALSGGRLLKLTKVTKVLVGVDARSSRTCTVSPLPGRLSPGLSGDYSSSDSDSPVKAPLVVDHRSTLMRKMLVASPSPLREDSNTPAQSTSVALSSTTGTVPIVPSESVGPWKKPSGSSKHRNYRQSGNDVTATNHLQTTLTVVASTGTGKKKRPDREVYQVRKRRSRSRSTIARSGGSKRHSDSRSKRRKRSLSVERDRGRSRSTRRRSRSRSRSSIDKRKKNKTRRRSTEKKSKKKKKAKGHKKTRVGDRSRTRSVSSSNRGTRDGSRRSLESKKSKKRSPNRSLSRSRSRSLYLSGRDSAMSKDDGVNKKKSSKSPEILTKRRKRKAHNKPLKDRIGEVVVIHSSRENTPTGQGDASGNDKNEKDIMEASNKETKEKLISAKGENLVINVNFKKSKLMNIFGDDASDEETVEKSSKDDKIGIKSSGVSPGNGKKASPLGKGPQTPPSNTADDVYDPCEPLADSPGGTATPTNDERDQQPVQQFQPTRIPGLGSPSPPTGGRDSPATLPSLGHGKPTVAVLPIVDNKSPRTKDQRGRRSPLKVQQPPQPPLPPPQSRDKPPSPAPPPALAPPPVPSFLFSQPPPSVQPQYIVMNPYLVNPYHAMMPMQAATAPLVASAAPVAQVSLTAATVSRDSGLRPPEGSPYSPGESPLFNDPITPPTPLSAEETGGTSPAAVSRSRGGGVFDQIAAGVARQPKRKEKKKHKVVVKTAGQLMAESGGDGADGADRERYVRMDESQMKILDELPSSAVELQVKEKFLQKLHRQERVVEEVKLALKPFYNKKQVSKDDYKLIMKKCVPKICHNKNGEINPAKIKALVEGYVKKFRHSNRKHKQAPSQTSQSNTTSAGAAGNS
ncbi:hypothetical protein BIW11_08823 [Tropilaelaps mercedesae]|uniref:SFR19-like C-terminal domain-containing protein n=1 Tax=Tropilaelaps mercedesae TaxID=418985 RepID=A0A1V9XMU2_9ACAR|nr:hypothetical protein BIW11_08823 [Tropilaelaps mercedesae]